MEDITLKDSYLLGRFELLPLDGLGYMLFIEAPQIAGNSFVVNARFKDSDGYFRGGWLKFDRKDPARHTFQLTGFQNLEHSIISDSLRKSMLKQYSPDEEGTDDLPQPTD